MSRVSKAATDWYKRIDTLWPEPLPVMTAEEAIAVGRRLYRFARGKAFKGQIKVTTGNRYSYIRSMVMYVNAERSWSNLVHELSHHFHRAMSNERPHGEAHAVLEYRMVKHVIDSGWLDGRFKKVAKPKPDVRAIRYQRALDKLEAWQRKAKRAETAIKKLRKQVRYYERTAQSTVVDGNETRH